MDNNNLTLMVASASSILSQIGKRRSNSFVSLRIAVPAMLTSLLFHIPNCLAFEKPNPGISKLNIAAINIDSPSLIDQWYNSLSHHQSLVPEVSKLNRSNQTDEIHSAQKRNDSLWLRLAEQSLLETPFNNAIDRELELFSKNIFWTERNLKDAGPYLHYVLSRLEERKLPLELALLPIIESGYNPAARSHLNAMGLWQLVPSTAKSLGLTINEWTDERKDIQKSTEAALDYLEQMHKSLKSWPLTVAAYNAGPSRIRFRVKKIKKQNFEIWDVSLPTETRRYVAKFFALNELIRRADEFSLKLPAIPHEPVFAEMKVNTRISLTAAAELAELPIEHLTMFNHDLLTSATPPNGPHSVVVPVNAKKAFQSNLDIAIQRSAELYRPTFYHTVKTGESLSVIAAKHRLSVNEIKALNKLKGSKIKSGQKILLVAMKETKKTAPEHTVRKGDTLSEIADMYGVRRSIIAKTNNINNDDMLHVGKILIIPARYIPSDKEKIRYTVKSGDTLSEIAELFKVSLPEIKRLNPPLAEAQTILPGQKVFIPKNTY